jgi:hypothetical protein
MEGRWVFILRARTKISVLVIRPPANKRTHGRLLSAQQPACLCLSAFAIARHENHADVERLSSALLPSRFPSLYACSNLVEHQEMAFS